MTRMKSVDTEDLTLDGIKRALKYLAFDTICRMLEVGKNSEERKRLRRRRAELEQKRRFQSARLSHDAWRKSRRHARLTAEETRAFLAEARDRIRRALQRRSVAGLVKR
jgi:cytochrome P450